MGHEKSWTPWEEPYDAQKKNRTCRLSSWRSRPIGRVTATLARACRPRWVDTLLIDSPSHTTQVEARGGAPPRVRVRVAVWMYKFSQPNLLVSRRFSRSDPSRPKGRGISPRTQRASLTLLAPCAERRIDGPGSRAARINSEKHIQRRSAQELAAPPASLQGSPPIQLGGLPREAQPWPTTTSKH